MKNTTSTITLETSLYSDRILFDGFRRSRAGRTVSVQLVHGSWTVVVYGVMLHSDEAKHVRCESREAARDEAFRWAA